jgi:hypothetical protein
MTVPILSMREALDRKDYFGGQLSGDSWAKWRVLLIAIAGEPLLPDEVASFTELTGRATAPAEPPREFWGGALEGLCETLWQGLAGVGCAGGELGHASGLGPVIHC